MHGAVGTALKNPPMFSDLVIRTDEARRAFENHPVVLDAVANGMPLAHFIGELSNYVRPLICRFRMTLGDS